MTIAEKIELTLIPLCGVGLWLMRTGLPVKVSLGRLLLAASVLLLLQSLIRDLCLLAKQKRVAKTDQASLRRAARSMMCVESTLGVTGVVLGIILLGAGINRRCQCPAGFGVC